VEDIFTTSILHATSLSRIVIYQFNEFGKIISARIFDHNSAHNSDSPYLRAVSHYYHVIKQGKIEKVAALYSRDAVMEDPVGAPPRNISSVFESFYKFQKSFVLKRSSERTFVSGNQVAQLVNAEFHLKDGKTLNRTPIHIFTLDDDLEITHFEAFYQKA